VIGLPFHGRDLHGSSLWLLFGLLFSHHGLCLGAQRNFHTSAKIRASCPALKLEPHIVLLCILTTSDIQGVFENSEHLRPVGSGRDEMQ
jgi:hypothetical protein